MRLQKFILLGLNSIAVQQPSRLLFRGINASELPQQRLFSPASSKFSFHTLPESCRSILSNVSPLSVRLAKSSSQYFVTPCLSPNSKLLFSSFLRSNAQLRYNSVLYQSTGSLSCNHSSSLPVFHNTHVSATPSLPLIRRRSFHRGGGRGWEDFFERLRFWVSILIPVAILLVVAYYLLLPVLIAIVFICVAGYLYLLFLRRGYGSSSSGLRNQLRNQLFDKYGGDVKSAKRELFRASKTRETPAKAARRHMETAQALWGFASILRKVFRAEKDFRQIRKALKDNALNRIRHHPDILARLGNGIHADMRYESARDMVVNDSTQTLLEFTIAGSKGNAVAKVTASFSEGVAYESLIVQFPDGEVVDLDVRDDVIDVDYELMDDDAMRK